MDFSGLDRQHVNWCSHFFAIRSYGVEELWGGGVKELWGRGVKELLGGGVKELLGGGVKELRS